MSPYPQKKLRTSCSRTTTSTPPSALLLMDWCPPSTTTPPNTHTTSDRRNSALSSNATSWHNARKKLPASVQGQEPPKPRRDSWPTRGASPASSPWQEGGWWSHVSYDGGVTGKSKWWREGTTMTQSMSPRSSLLPTTHKSPPTP